MSFIDRLDFLNENNYSFKEERVKKKENIEGTSREKTFLRGLPENEVLAYFDAKKDRYMRSKFTFRTLDAKPLMYMKALHNINSKKRDLWVFFKLEEDLDSVDELEESSPLFIGRTTHESTITKAQTTFMNNEAKQLFFIDANKLGTHIVFHNRMSNEPEILAEGHRKMKTKWGWDYEFSIDINPSSDILTKALLIACMRVIAPLFYPR